MSYEGVHVRGQSFFPWKSSGWQANFSSWVAAGVHLPRLAEARHLQIKTLKFVVTVIFNYLLTIGTYAHQH